MRTVILEKGPLLRRYLLLAMIAGVPLLFSRFTNDPINVPKLALLVSGVGAVVFIRLVEILQGAPLTGLTRLSLPAASIGVPLIVGWTFAPYKAWSLLGAYGRYQGLVPYLLVVILGVLVADAFDASTASWVAWALVFAAGVAGAYAIVQRAGADPFDWASAGRVTSDATSTLGNSNFTGAFCGLSLPLVGALLLHAPDRRLIAGCLGLLAFGGWIAAGSQGAWGAGVAGLGVAFGFFLARKWRWAPIAGVVAAAAIGLAGVGLVISDLDQPARVSGGTGTAAVRAFAWRAAASSIAEHPVVGQGPNSFALLGVQHRSITDAISLDTNFPDDPHSVPLSMATSAGAFGVLGYVLLIAWVVRKGRALTNGGFLAGGFLGAGTAYLVQSLVSIDQLALSTSFWVVLGAVAALFVTPRHSTAPVSRRSKRVRGGSSRLRALPVVLLAVLIPAVAGWWSFRFVLADARAHWGLTSFSVGRADEGEDLLRSAVALRPDPYYWWKLSDGVAIAAVADNDIDGLQRARQLFGYLGDTPHYPGLIARARDMDEGSVVDPTLVEDAIDSYQELIRVDPSNPFFRVEAADVLADAGRLDDALSILSPTIEQAGGHVAAVWGELAVLRYNLSDFDGAKEAVVAAFRLDPTEPQAQVVEQALEESGQ